MQDEVDSVEVNSSPETASVDDDRNPENTTVLDGRKDISTGDLRDQVADDKALDGGACTPCGNNASRRALKQIVQHLEENITSCVNEVCS